MTALNAVRSAVRVARVAELYAMRFIGPMSFASFAGGDAPESKMLTLGAALTPQAMAKGVRGAVPLLSSARSIS